LPDTVKATAVTAKVGITTKVGADILGKNEVKNETAESVEKLINTGIKSEEEKSDIEQAGKLTTTDTVSEKIIDIDQVDKSTIKPVADDVLKNKFESDNLDIEKLSDTDNKVADRIQSDEKSDLDLEVAVDNLEEAVNSMVDNEDVADKPEELVDKLSETLDDLGTDEAITSEDLNIEKEGDTNSSISNAIKTAVATAEASIATEVGTDFLDKESDASSDSNAIENVIDSTEEKLEETFTKKLENETTKELEERFAEKLENETAKELEETFTKKLENEVAEELEEIFAEKLENEAVKELENVDSDNVLNNDGLDVEESTDSENVLRSDDENNEQHTSSTDTKSKNITDKEITESDKSKNPNKAEDTNADDSSQDTGLNTQQDNSADLNLDDSADLSTASEFVAKVIDTKDTPIKKTRGTDVDSIQQSNPIESTTHITANTEVIALSSTNNNKDNDSSLLDVAKTAVVTAGAVLAIKAGTEMLDDKINSDDADDQNASADNSKPDNQDKQIFVTNSEVDNSVGSGYSRRNMRRFRLFRK
jgi:hypothetical protein